MANKLKFTNQEEKQLLELFKTEKDITSLAKEFCKLNKKYEYQDGIRRAISRVLERYGVTDNKITLEQSEQFISARKRILVDSKFYFSPTNKTKPHYTKTFTRIFYHIRNI